MSDAEWDAEDFEPKDPTAKSVPTDKWEGEDEDEDVKDAWDADSDKEESKDDDDPNAPKAVQRKKKKKLSEIIAEKEAAAEAKKEAKLSEERDRRLADTPEGRAAEKKRLLKMEENVNLELAKDMLGLKTADSGLDALSAAPNCKDDFDKLEKALSARLGVHSSSDHFPDFVESLVKSLCIDLNAAGVKRVKMAAESLHAAKLKQEKETKAKKGKGKSLRMDTSKDLFSADSGAGYNDMDDFM